MSERPSLVEFAARRFRLAGKSILDPETTLGSARLIALDRKSRRAENALISFAHYDYLGLSGHATIRLGPALAPARSIRNLLLSLQTWK